MADFDAAYFESNYVDYEAQNPTRKLAHYHRTIRDRISDGPCRVLDIGCGLGLWAAYMANTENAWVVTGMDVNRDVVAHNAVRFPKVTFKSGRAGQGEPPEPFDVITAMDVLEHVPHIDDQFNAILSWLAPGGLFAFVVPVYDGPLGPAVHFLDKDPTHIHKWGRHRWLSLAEKSLEDVRWHGAFRIMIPGGIYIHVPTHRLRTVSPAILVTGRVPER